MWRSGSVSVLGIEGHMFKSYHSDIYFMLVFLNFLLIMSSLFVFISENPVNSVLFLILSFLCSSSICFYFGADFLGLIFIIIYVGAIAVLFFFIIMMLNIKLGENKNSYFSLIYILSLIVFLEIYFHISNYFSNFLFYQFNFFFFDNFSSEFFIGQLLYNYYSFCFLIAGIILLVAMIGSIVLTLTFTNKKSKKIEFRQQVRTDNFLSFFK